METGLQYTKNGRLDNVNRFVKKFKKDIKYAQKNFNEFSKVFMLWTLIVRIPKKENTKHNQLKGIHKIISKIKNSKGITIEVIYNEKFYACIQELRKVARLTTSAMTSPIMRFLQIEERLKKLLKK